MHCSVWFTQNKLPAAALRSAFAYQKRSNDNAPLDGSIARYKNNASTGFHDGSQLGTEKFRNYLEWVNERRLHIGLKMKSSDWYH